MVVRKPVVVGIDGTPANKAAISWAIDEARSRDVPLRMVYVLETLVRSEFEWRPAYSVPGIRNPAEEMLLSTLADAKQTADGVEIGGEVRPGFRTDILIEESHKAAVLVLGSRNLGVFRSLMGSTGTAVAARAVSPVVVVRGSGQSTDGDTGTTEEAEAPPEPAPAAYSTPVVVGVDGSGRAPHVLGFAFDYADRRGLPVRVVLGVSRLPWAGHSAANGPEQGWERLDELLDGWRTAYPTTDVEALALEGRPTDVLVTQARGADLLVVGARSRHAVVATLLGSVSQGVLHHATCPVAVVHAPQRP